mmetsp:Transcript_47789/g.132816  ORF Transcript_47789/g.132816 Transcript_47789/m.132816 type:complete len:258 (+) Transcript_47789:281-1054(+)
MLRFPKETRNASQVVPCCSPGIGGVGLASVSLLRDLLEGTGTTLQARERVISLRSAMHDQLAQMPCPLEQELAGRQANGGRSLGATAGSSLRECGLSQARSLCRTNACQPRSQYHWGVNNTILLTVLRVTEAGQFKGGRARQGANVLEGKGIQGTQKARCRRQGISSEGQRLPRSGSGATHQVRVAVSKPVRLTPGRFGFGAQVLQHANPTFRPCLVLDGVSDEVHKSEQVLHMQGDPMGVVALIRLSRLQSICELL